MAVQKTTEIVNMREDLGDVISRISPEQTPFYTEINKTKAKNTYHEFTSDELAPPNKDNAKEEGADAGAANNTVAKREGNWAQIFEKVRHVSATSEAVDIAGVKSNTAYQLATATAEIKRDIEAALVSANASIASGERKLAGAEAWLSTNALHGVGGDTPGFSNGTVGAVTAGTTRALTEDMFNELAEMIWNEGGNPTKVIASGSLKKAISKFSGNAQKYQEQDKSKTVYAGVDVYVSDFGTHQIIPHHFMSKTTVIAFDPKFWSVATLRSLKREDLGKSGSSTKFMLETELTLESKNEKASGKVADVTPA
ncbi:SU10 major capsid protein [Agrobacterium tumefaciens]|uniref:DUF5309 domain-containing protein n=1 Tax=Agrobacterium tumefaciens TaxID=358 RepID=A0AA44JAN5_AGRTU|nr:DUF5309 family protein [Agrobacterium tumefaciens]NTB86854.1 DUF5309 domain-containing protein [Agrobacterium tumefaciens]NTC21183.1 DUF5309 domain-containing protein [Agrobacterium tumefaciens]NTC30731.1 DUF5309 domain-containing protein [Agrobacterium tumefaciens]